MPARSILEDLYVDAAQTKRSEQSTFDLLTKLGLPGLSIVALIVAELKDQRSLMWALLGLTILLVAVGFWHPLKARTQHLISRRSDERRARRAYPRLKRFVQRFNEFVSAQQGDNLNNVVRDAMGSDGAKIDKLHLAPISIFDTNCHYLRARLETERQRLDQILCTLDEFSNLVSLFNNHCVSLVFDRFPADLRASLTDSGKSTLEAFRERFSQFLHEYSEYLKHLDESFSQRRITVLGFPRPKPL